ncbi:ABC transporter permease [Microvirga sp. M2]|uniref:ABC transporter permease n=1 Tax=Microvirga sp. M2 TaxID=3073270 RepID=UPI0039C09520
MALQLLRRLGIAIPSILGISVLLYLLLSLAPGDPFEALAGNPNIPPEVATELRVRFGLDEPFLGRYISWLGAMLTGDWGFSFASRVDVLTLIGQRVLPTLFVAGCALLLAVCLAVPVGVRAGLRPGSVFDQLANLGAFIGFSLPTFFTGMLLILLFGIWLRLLPTVYEARLNATGFEWLLLQLRQSILPILVLALVQFGIYVRIIRASVIEVVRQDHVRTAVAKGLKPRRVVWIHIFGNALLPLVTMIALQLPSLFGGAIITEQIFRVPGVGSLLIEAILSNDTPVIMAIAFISSVLVVLCNILADLLCMWIDPRIRRS